jgi:hypothetical protein
MIRNTELTTVVETGFIYSHWHQSARVRVCLVCTQTRSKLSVASLTLASLRKKPQKIYVLHVLIYVLGLLCASHVLGVRLHQAWRLFLRGLATWTAMTDRFKGVFVSKRIILLKKKKGRVDESREKKRQSTQKKGIEKKESREKKRVERKRE